MTPACKESSLCAFLSSFCAGLGGGLVGGAMAGYGEAGWVYFLSRGASPEYLCFPWGAILYGVLGAGIGGAVGFAGAAGERLRRRPANPSTWSALGMGCTLAAFALVIGRFRFGRDVLHEAPMSAAHHSMFLALAAAIVAGAWFGLRPLFRRRGWRRLGGFSGMAAGFTILAALSFPLHLLLRAPGPQPFTPLAPEETAGRPMILYFMVDTLRADHLNAYGYAGNDTPAINALAADSVLFEEAISHSSWTKPSVATQLSSLHPHEHGARFKASGIRRDVVLLPEALSAAGYFCAGNVNAGHIGSIWGFGRGWNRYGSLVDKAEGGSRASVFEMMGARLVLYRWFSIKSRPMREPRATYTVAEEVFADARQAIEQRPAEAPCFFFLHFFDPHDPYYAHPFTGKGYPRYGNEHPPVEDRERMIRLYDGEIEYFDRELGEFVEWLKAQGLYDEALIALVSDHGEEFHDHGGWWHGLTLYEEQLHVPLMIKLPGQRLAGERVADPARLLDLAPTLTALAGLDAPASWQGEPLIGDAGARGSSAEFQFSETDLEGNYARAIRGQGRKWIGVNPGNRRGLPTESFFDLQADPQEQNNLSESAPDAADAFRQQARGAFTDEWIRKALD